MFSPQRPGWISGLRRLQTQGDGSAKQRLQAAASRTHSIRFARNDAAHAGLEESLSRADSRKERGRLVRAFEASFFKKQAGEVSGEASPLLACFSRIDPCR